MTKQTIILIALTFVAACSTDAAGTSVTKDQAATTYAGGKSDGVDFCEELSWYGDGECDTFCPLADQDCSGEVCTVGADSTCGVGEHCAPGYCDFWCPPDSASCCEPAACVADAPEEPSEDADCRTDGCDDGSGCSLCWGTYQCLPDGDLC